MPACHLVPGRGRPSIDKAQRTSTTSPGLNLPELPLLLLLVAACLLGPEVWGAVPRSRAASMDSLWSKREGGTNAGFVWREARDHIRRTTCA
jgi:hypothetical protein